MCAVTQQGSPHSRRSSQEHTCVSQLQDSGFCTPSHRIAAPSTQAERIDNLVDPFVDLVSPRSDALCVLLRAEFESDEDSPSASRQTVLDMSREDEGIRRCVNIAQHVRGLFCSVGVDAESSHRIESILQHCLRVACAAHLLAKQDRDVDPILAFACGMIHDIGRIVLATQFPKACGRVEQAIRSGEGDAVLVESSIFGVDHAVVGGHLLLRWSIPAAIQQVAFYHHHDSQDFPDEIGQNACVAIIKMADAQASQTTTISTKEADGETGYERGVQSDGHGFAQAVARLLQKSETQMERSDHTPVGAHHATANQSPAPSPNDPIATRSSIGSDVLHRFFQRVVELPARVSDFERLNCETARILSDTLGVTRHVVFAQVDCTHFQTCTFDRSNDAHKPEIRHQRAIVRSPVLLDGDAAVVRDAHTTPYQELADRFARFFGVGSLGVLAFQQGPNQPGGFLFSMEDDGWRFDQIEGDTLRIISLTLGTVYESMLLKRELQVQARELDQSEQARRAEHAAAVRTETLNRVAQMAAGAAHELNNPLSIIAGRAQLLQAKVEDEAIQTDLRLITAQAKRAGEMVTQLMDYARPAPPDPVEIRLSDWANRLRQHWYRQSGFKPDQIQIHLNSDDLTVFADERQFRDAADAIMSNAVEAIRSKNGPDAIKSGEFANIHINSPSAATDDTIVVAISDNGGGMPSDVCEHALDPFFSYRAAGRRQGLGLSRAARYIEINGGRFWIDSTEGEETTVSFSLPARSRDSFGS